MLTLPTLLKKLEALHRQHVELEHEIGEVERQIVSIGNAPKPRAKRSTRSELLEVVKSTVQILREAGEALPGSEIASRLGITSSAVAYRLKLAIESKFVEKVGRGRYQTTSVVPAFEG